ncbi:MAG: TetR/AcrR family transcriptional regulator [Flavobacteriaceae bacterium CG_4_10_14_3_um_filter_31_253]|nr:MAG: TetR/AcrR family transcriptional regulator [Flavobacteriaceae bacterium CG17_big_fil_post_rev_8_21_14_2_50_31_13]PIX11012.1 MAG: TetR/AcrR family transcriptional regulator [Flavobacteriaceae bacterium CG_4_8_14_3_um_filter_31_8]PIY14083.1 MAG: TetR/AcrR family transcriptional regulator [Flavobacteriaceae bacterium CG_4_10_14_3_um_filter_31_253]PIZ09405.1 MAG: TetR/AcrR family transcriptional regulator [Flavobacteriaceae bacterium CG_4_10_14_0_8_um_filter_31_99]PJC10462.1 MAG: TetR/AcrR 
MTITISDRQFEIIEAAGKILTTFGISGLTIKNLAKEMKFSESALYRHFTSKEEIIIVLLEYLAKNMEERYTTAISIEQSPEDKFITLFQNQFSFFNENPHFVVAVFSDGLLEESIRINEVMMKIMNVKIKHLLPIISEGQQKKIFTNSITSDELIHIVMGTFRLQMFKWRIANFQFDISRNGDNMIQALLTLIKNK